jgi:hypothetical protein
VVKDQPCPYQRAHGGQAYEKHEAKDEEHTTDGNGGDAERKCADSVRRSDLNNSQHVTPYPKQSFRRSSDTLKLAERAEDALRCQLRSLSPPQLAARPQAGLHHSVGQNAIKAPHTDRWTTVILYGHQM